MRPDLDWGDVPMLVLRASCALLALRFVLRYSRVDWRATAAGRHIMAFAVITSIFMTLATTTVLFGRYPGIDFVTIALYGWLFWLLARQNAMFTQAQRDAADDPA